MASHKTKNKKKLAFKRKEINNPFRRKKRHEFLLDEILAYSVSMRSVLKFIIYALIFVIIIVGSFFIGRISAQKMSSDNNTQITELTTQMDYEPINASLNSSINSTNKASVSETVSSKDDLIPDNKTATEIINQTEQLGVPIIIEPSENDGADNNSSIADTAAANNINNSNSTISSTNQDNLTDQNPTVGVSTDEYTDADESAKYVIREYLKVITYLEDHTFNTRGEDWGSIENLELIITNGETFTVYPQTIKMKIYAANEVPPKWFDDEINLEDQKIKITSGSMKTINIETKITTSDLEEDKKLHIAFFDVYDELISTKVQTINLAE
ncbi:hypothetical protein HN587_06185 [Candidatus Woesearchaeota archaeon]|nr:hypothetical protein [Candidatus Woesearchaeota archaeon]